MGEERRAVVRRTRAEGQTILPRFERSGQSSRALWEAECFVSATSFWKWRELGHTVLTDGWGEH